MKRSASDNQNISCETKSIFLEPLVVKPITRHQKIFPHFRQPVEFGSFSLDGNRQYYDDNHQLKYCDTPKSNTVNYNLRDGYDTCVQKDDDIKERLTNLLKWISKHRNKFTSQNDEKNDQNARLNTDFVAWRGHFTKFLCTPYEKRDPWKMAVTLYEGTIYISEVETQKGYNDRKNRPPRQEEMCYWGYRFEGYLTKPLKESSEEHDDENDKKIVNTNEAFVTVVRSRLNKHSMLMGAEVDCCEKNSHEKAPLNYIELKTTRQMQYYKQKMNFARFKLLKFWAQSFLAGLPKIIVGLRNDDGVVQELKTYKTLEIPSLCKEYSNHWEPSICMNFLNELLTWLKRIVTVDDKNVVYMLSFEQPFDRVTVKFIKDGSERFLPEWFTDADSQVT